MTQKQLYQKYNKNRVVIRLGDLDHAVLKRIAGSESVHKFAKKVLQGLINKYKKEM